MIAVGPVAAWRLALPVARRFGPVSPEATISHTCVLLAMTHVPGTCHTGAGMLACWHARYCAHEELRAFPSGVYNGTRMGGTLRGDKEMSRPKTRICLCKLAIIILAASRSSLRPWHDHKGGPDRDGHPTTSTWTMRVQKSGFTHRTGGDGGRSLYRCAAAVAALGCGRPRRGMCVCT